MNNLVLRRATDADDERLIDLYCHCYAKTMGPEWWSWWAHGSPNGRNRTYVAEDPGTSAIVGAYSLASFDLWLNGRLTTASLCNNVCTHRDYRRRGVFSGLGYFALSADGHLGVPLSVGMPNSNALPGHMRVGWTVACRLPFVVKQGCVGLAHGCRDVLEFDASVERLQARIRPRFSFLPIRSARAMNWRYLKRPGVTYRLVVVDDYPEIRGYAVLKRYGEKIHIVDMHAETECALHDLLCCAQDHAAGAEELSLYSNQHSPYASALEGHGFTQRKGHDCLILHGNIANTELPDPARGWSFHLGTNDVF